MKTLLFMFIISFTAGAQTPTDFGYLKPEDQKFFQNDNFEGKNKVERIDSNVKEINKLHQEIVLLKDEVKVLKAMVISLKNAK